MFTAITILSPVLVFVLAELLLRVAGYGPDLSLFQREQIGGREYYIMNPEVKSRYFTSVDFSPTTSLDYFPVEKKAGTFRIFCLGGSTTVGFPYGYIGSFSSYVRRRLSALFPERTFEVINLGMTATNSFTTLDIARELPAYKPDLILVYDGHNEFYGALGVASHENVGRARWLPGLYLRLIHSRVFLLIRDVYNGVRSMTGNASTTLRSGTLMERLARGQHIPYRSEPYEETRLAFAENLRKLAGICKEDDIPLILSTQVSNLRDLPPFVSGEGLRKEPGRWMEYNAHFNRGLELFMSSRADSALGEFRRALAIDSLRAEAHYQTARCLDALGRRHDAATSYARARDLDMLRFRTSSDFNEVIRSMTDPGHVFVVDMEQPFAAASPDSLIGRSLILEHLHPNERGYFLMGAAYVRAMRGAGLVAEESDWARRDTIAEQRFWEQRPATDLDRRFADRRMTLLMSGWPFRPDDALPPSPAPQDTLGQITERFLRGETSWEQAHVAAADYYGRRGDTLAQIAEYRALIDQIPANVSAYLILSQILQAANRYQEALEILEHSLTVERTSHALRTLGIARINAKDPKGAIPLLTEALDRSQSMDERVSAGYALSMALARAGREDEAIGHLETVLSLEPDHRPSRALLKYIQGKRSGQ